MDEPQWERAKSKIKEDADIREALLEVKTDCLEVLKNTECTALEVFRMLGARIDELTGTD